MRGVPGKQEEGSLLTSVAYTALQVRGDGRGMVGCGVLPIPGRGVMDEHRRAPEVGLNANGESAFSAGQVLTVLTVVTSQ
jgi:hypothetical protein